jgi:hypothetical protein
VGLYVENCVQGSRERSGVVESGSWETRLKGVVRRTNRGFAPYVRKTGTTY